MSTTLEALEAEALKLAPADRSHLLARLVTSLGSDSEIDAAWQRLADRSQADGASGAVDEVHGRMAMARLLARLPR